jgi:hypothetical protein
MIKKMPNFKCNKVSVLIVLVLVLQPPVLVLVFEKEFYHCLIKGKKLNKQPKKYPKLKCNTVSVSPSASSPSSVVVSSKEEKKKESGCLS